MGRRKDPITGSGPVAQLALSLHRLRAAAGLTLRELALDVGYSHSTLASAERGRIPPSWAVTEAFVRGCGKLAGDWRELWLAASAASRGLESPHPGTAPVARPAQLPSRVPGFTGRARELSLMRDLAISCADRPLGPPVICAIEGMAGAGKTALALQFAHQVRERFPDGQLFVSARGCVPDGEPLLTHDIVLHLLRGLGCHPSWPAAGTSELANAYRSQTDGQRMLIVLDDADSPEQVRAAIPGSGPSLVLITSRNSLNGLVVRDGAVQLRLGDLPAEDCARLLAEITTGPGAGPRPAARIAELCGYLPLALRIAAHQLSTGRFGSPGELARALAVDAECLDVLAVSGDESSSIRAVLSWSYRTLTADSAAALRVIGRELGGTFEFKEAVEALGASPARSQALLRALTERNLLSEAGPERYHCHRLVALYAAELTG